MSSKKIIKLSGFCGILTLIIPILTIIISINIYPSFDWTENAISDLGVEEAASNFFNYGLVLTGICLLLFSYGLLFFFGEKQGPAILGFSSIFLIGVGLVPLPNNEHIIMSVPFFISLPLSFLILGMQMYNRIEDYFKKMGIFAFAVVIISLFSAVPLLFFNGVAIPEFLVITPAFIWCSVMGYKMLIS
jgi:hypothetical membrane protein